jgi:hypothetical protein
MKFTRNELKLTIAALLMLQEGIPENGGGCTGIDQTL